MKILSALLIVAALAAIPAGALAAESATPAPPPDSLGLPGDNLNLYAVLDAFRTSPTLEEFEQRLNTRANGINNLDLDGDGKVDYIRVVDEVHGDIHDIILRVPLGKDHSQDVAVIQVGHDEQGALRVQIIGDEDLYGPGYILEPAPVTATPNPGYVPPAGEAVPPPEATSYVAVSEWPVVQTIIVPAYQPWVSPWYWGYWPPYWDPWEPWYWHFYWGWHSHSWYAYHHHYHHHHQPCFPHAWDDYHRHGRERSHDVETRIADGAYRPTYSRPELRREGVTRYRSEHPQTLRPTARPGAAPGGIRSTTPTGRQPITVTRRPAARPAPTTPGTRPSVSKPPASAPAPAVRPTTSPATPSKPSAQPAPRPATPTAPAKPAAKPKTTPAKPPAKPGTPTGTGTGKTTSPVGR